VASPYNGDQYLRVDLGNVTRLTALGIQGVNYGRWYPRQVSTFVYFTLNPTAVWLPLRSPCLTVYMQIYQISLWYAYLPSCLFSDLTVFQFENHSISLPIDLFIDPLSDLSTPLTHLFASLRAYAHTYISTCLPPPSHVYVPDCLSACLPNTLSACRPFYQSTYIVLYVPTSLIGYLLIHLPT